MSARAWQRRRAGQWSERPSYREWVPRHSNVSGPTAELMLYGELYFEDVYERPITRARRLRAERFARRQHRRHPQPPPERRGYEPLGTWIDEINQIVHSGSIVPDPALERFILGVTPSMRWSLPDADPLDDVRAAHRQAQLDYYRSLNEMHKTTTVLDECEIAESLDA